jgi:hypothetical protein
MPTASMRTDNCYQLLPTNIVRQPSTIEHAVTIHCYRQLRIAAQIAPNQG